MFIGCTRHNRTHIKPKPKMVIKKENAIKRQFKGVDFDVLAVGLKSMVTKMNFEVGVIIPFHSHPNEQSGYVISGKYLLKLKENSHLLTAGDTYSIPENAEHSLEIIEAGNIIDFFTPPRQDYL
jgi:quercetin dioxygenase-like cupin family protein